MSDKKYWKGLDEKKQVPAFVERSTKEFSDELPLVSELAEVVDKKKGGRRDFLKMLGFSVSAATVAAACEVPVRKSIPYVFKPEEITPGMPTYYATTFYRDGDLASVLIKTREGRPILAEGNSKSKISKGGTSSRVQATVLGLYDGARIRAPYMNGDVAEWTALDKEVVAKLSSMRDAGERVVLLTGTVVSPTTSRAINDLKAVYPNIEHIAYDTISFDGILSANESDFGKRAVPAYHMSKAKLLVGISADFLATWLSPIELSADYANARRVNKEHTKMMRHVQIESIPTLTGSNADNRVPVMPADERLAALKLYNLVAAKLGGSKVDDGGYENEGLASVADELVANRGKAIVMCGINDANTQRVVNELNKLLNSYDKTITWEDAYRIKSASDKQVGQFVDDLAAGKIKGVMVHECNPAHTLPNATTFVEAYTNCDFTLSFSERTDETVALSKYLAPDHHYLESWNDLEPKKGHYCMVQPTIQPLFKTRQMQQSLLAWAGNNKEYYNYLRDHWNSAVFPAQSTYSSFDSFWDSAVHDGEVRSAASASSSHTNGHAHNNGADMMAAAGAMTVAENAEEVMDAAENMVDAAQETMAASASSGDLSSAASAAVKAAKAMAGNNQLKVYHKIAIGNGYISESPWLQEMPDPISKICYDNYVMANPRWVDENGLTPNYKNMEHKMVKLTVGEYSVTVPVVPQPGTPYGAFGIALGYGKTVVTHDELKIGGNAAPFMHMNGSQWCDVVSGASIEATGEGDLLAITQTNYNISGMTLGGDKTRFIVKETTLADYKEDPWSGNNVLDTRRDKWLEHHLKTPYPEHEMGGHHWGMSIDLSTCTGCGACVTACHAENNVPMVGKYEVRRAHDMHWLRIDRYYLGDEDNPEVIFQPMLCQHCDNAPCENVCPVAATTHSSEGMNQMTYNRCIGTRYCANNCPYKVRRFNWYDFQGADSFNDVLSNEGNPFDGRPFQAPGVLDDMTRMVLNPDVTVRSRGVMEKCSFCVQRTQYAKLEAKKDGRKLQGDEVATACESACPTNAIVFGDVNDKDSKIHELVFKDERTFGVIEEIHTLPSVTYMTKVRNKEEVEISKTVRNESADHA